jgi:diadenosine tetraphosphate (Ap4A) HIT family hydrolase
MVAEASVTSVSTVDRAPGCEICERIAKFTPENPYLIAELQTGYAVLADNQYIEGYTIFLSKTCVPELHLLLPEVRATFLDEMSLVAEAVFRAFTPRKLNYELLGNSVSHLHWHLFPRYEDDPNPRFPVWLNPEFMKENPRPSHEQLDAARHRVRSQLDALRT